MEKKAEIMSLINQLGEIQEKKKETIKNQQYEDAAALRDDEKLALKKLDVITGVDDFYKKVYKTEKILQHLDKLVHSTTELQKLRPNFREVFADMDFNEYRVKLYKQRDEAYEAVLLLRKFTEK